MDELHNFTQGREAELELLEKMGKRYTEDPETKERIETDDYKKLKNLLKEVRIKKRN